jgi:thiol-disulfide isomerase/thioredoxin
MSCGHRTEPAKVRPLWRALARGMLLLGVLAGSQAQAAEPDLSGRWNASVDVGALHVPFPFQIAIHGSQAEGWFFNGDERVVSSGGTFDQGHLLLEFATYARRIDATLDQDGSLSGGYVPMNPKATLRPYKFHAERAPAPAPAGDAHPPQIAGNWLILAPSTKAGEQAWRFIVHQAGAVVSGAILRVDGDTGELSGIWRGGKLLLSHFDGARPSAFLVTPGNEGTLQVVERDRDGADQTLTAYRAETAAAKGLPGAADPEQHTSVRDAAEPFRFSFPDLAGHVVASTDSRFQGKVLIVDIGGSWCPNCHDEAPLLEELYKKYRSRGLEVVTLSFEEAEQLENPTRLRAFIEHYHLDYTVLLAGTTDQLHEKVPQAVNLDAYPTTFFIGRDGRVRAVHAGFAARATGEFNTRLRQDFTRQIEQLLAEKVPQATPRQS